jgi:hypothetical protein
MLISSFYICIDTIMNTYASEKQERYFFYNSLAILLKAVEGERTTVDLRNEASIYGVVEQADGLELIIVSIIEY